MTTNDLVKELSQNFIDYAVAVNTDRAIPDARDGLKPVAKRILYGAYVNGRSSKKPYVKNARIVGDVMGQYHPHGDSSIYGALVRLSQGWIMRYPLIDFHGNQGNIGGDGPAASRYTEGRLAPLAEDGLLRGIKKHNVDFTTNYDESLEEPVVLPSIFPNLLCNPNTGIGVAMASSWLPHNLSEVAEAIVAYLNGEEPTLPGPDFPTGGQIINGNDIPAILKTGHGSVKVRGKYKVEKNKIIFYEIPYGTTTEAIITELGELAEKNPEFEITDIHDESNKNGLRIVIICKKEKSVPAIINKVFQDTDLQSSISYNQIALIDKTPTELNLKDCIKIYVEHTVSCLTKEKQYDLKEAIDRLEIVNGLLKALEDIDNVIALIKSSESSQAAKANLIKTYALSDAQAKAILAMRLSSLAKLEKIELEKEKAELDQTIKHIKEWLVNREMQEATLKDRLNELVKKYGDARRTEIANIKVDKKDTTAFVPPEECVVILTEAGTIQRVPSTNFKVQKRNGKGVKTPMDITKSIIRTNTVDSLLVFSDKGKLYKLSVNDIPVDAKNVYLKNLTNMEYDENPVIIYSLYKGSQYKYILFATKQGLIKRTPIEEYVGTRKKNGIAAIKLRDGDELAAAALMTDEEVLLVSSLGHVIRIDGNQISIYSKTASGIKGIKLDENDEVLTALPVRDTKDDILLCFEDGRGKRIPLDLITKQNRGGVGQKFASSKIIGTALVNDNDALLVIGKRRSICIKASDIKQIVSRQSEGVALIKDDKITSVSKV